jgi:hypothetical protein
MTSSAMSLRVWVKWAVLSALAFFFLTVARPAFGQDNWEIYRNAIKDAATYNRNKVVPLHLLKEEGGKVLVVTYTNYPYPDPPYPKTYQIPSTVYIWVTGEGEVQGTCRQFHLSGDSLRLRLDQLLGLKPDTSYATFVVLSVAGDRIFRPAPDPNPWTVLPCADPPDNQCGNVFPSNVPSDYFSFFAKQSTSAYRVGQQPADNGYPWTHLGYTYDWLPYGATKYGASEYVIKPGTEVTIIGKSTMDEYCKAP